MTEYVRPISRLKAIDLSDMEIAEVSGAFFEMETLQTQVMTDIPNSDLWKFDGMKAD